MAWPKEGHSASRMFSRMTVRYTRRAGTLAQLLHHLPGVAGAEIHPAGQDARDSQVRVEAVPTTSTVWSSWARPLKAMTWASTGTRSSATATRALTVRTPRVGGQSMST